MTNQENSSITVSIVLYNNYSEHIEQLCDSLKNTSIPLDVYFVDNSPTDALGAIVKKHKAFHYKWIGKNIGFSKAHNMIMEPKLNIGDYHLALNPDVFFDHVTIESIFNYLERNKDIGLLLPKVLNPDQTNQPLYKLLPKAQDLLLRRFIPTFLKSLFQKSLDRYKMGFADVDQNFDAPYLSGCFMFFRKSALKEVGLFDPRFFLYCEDVDLSRRIAEKWRTNYFPKAQIYHYFYKGSYKKLDLLYYHVSSAIKYFNKHGWFTDPIRDSINERVIENFKERQRVENFHLANKTQVYVRN